MAPPHLALLLGLGAQHALGVPHALGAGHGSTARQLALHLPEGLDRLWGTAFNRLHRDLLEPRRALGL
eukprot:7708649-Lingulodinium_polyedra.AAC.1